MIENLFNREERENKDAADIVMLVTRESLVSLMKDWNVNFDDRSQVILLVQLSYFHIMTIDMLNSSKMSLEKRSKMIHSMMDTIKKYFKNQNLFGTTNVEKDRAFDELLYNPVARFENCKSILADGDENSLIYTATAYFIETFVQAVEENFDYITYYKVTGKVLIESTALLMEHESIKTIMDR